MNDTHTVIRWQRNAASRVPCHVFFIFSTIDYTAIDVFSIAILLAPIYKLLDKFWILGDYLWLYPGYTKLYVQMGLNVLI